LVVNAPGYASKTSALVGAPPEVTDINLTLDAINLPKCICRWCGANQLSRHVPIRRNLKAPKHHQALSGRAHSGCTPEDLSNAHFP